VAHHPEGRVYAGAGVEREQLCCESFTVHVSEANDDGCLEPDREPCVSADLERGMPRAQASYKDKLTMASALDKNEGAGVTK
jgi:hypothetical protein